MTGKGKGTTGCAGDQPHQPASLPPTGDQPHQPASNNSKGGKLQAVQQCVEEEGSGANALTLSVDIVVAVGQRCTSVGEVWALTTTCKSAATARRDPALPAGWLLHNKIAHPIFAAMRKLPNAPAVIKALLRMGADPNAPAPQHSHSTLLALAVGSAETELVSVLLAGGARPDLAGGAVQDPLSLACALGDVRTAEMLIKYGAVVDQPPGRSMHVPADTHAWLLSQGCSNKPPAPGSSSDSVEPGSDTAASAGTDTDTSTDAEVWQVPTPLQAAAAAGQVEAVQLLLAHGANVEAGTPDAGSPLVLAAAAGHADVVRKLIRAGANMQACNSRGTALTNAVAEGHADVVDALLHAGADVNFIRPADPPAPGRPPPDSLHHSPLMSAAVTGNVGIMKRLLAKGAALDRATERGMTALGAAVVMGKRKAVKVLLAAGADIDVQDALGQTPLMYAAADGAVQMARMLLAHGADRMVRDASGAVAFVLAALNGHVDLVPPLLPPTANLAYLKGPGGMLLFHKQPGTGVWTHGSPEQLGMGAGAPFDAMAALAQAGAATYGAPAAEADTPQEASSSCSIC